MACRLVKIGEAVVVGIEYVSKNGRLQPDVGLVLRDPAGKLHTLLSGRPAMVAKSSSVKELRHESEPEPKVNAPAI